MGTSLANVGSYGAGRTQENGQDTVYTLSRDKAMESVNYECTVNYYPKVGIAATGDYMA